MAQEVLRKTFRILFRSRSVETFFISFSAVRDLTVGLGVEIRACERVASR